MILVSRLFLYFKIRFNSIIYIMKKNLLPLIIVVLFLSTNSSFAQTNNDKAIFERVFKDAFKDDRPFKTYRYVTLNGTIVITYRDGSRSEERRVGKECRSGWAVYD